LREFNLALYFQRRYFAVARVEAGNAGRTDVIWTNPAPS
jgi:hypothetical protein